VICADEEVEHAHDVPRPGRTRLATGYLGSVEAALRSGTDDYDFVASVRRYGLRIVTYTVLWNAGVLVLGVLAVINPLFILVGVVLFLWASYRLYATPYLIVVRDLPLGAALQRSWDWGREGGEYAVVYLSGARNASRRRFVRVDGRTGEREIDVDGVVPDDRSFRSSVFDEVQEVQFLEFGQVAVNLADVPIDETCRLADARWLVLDDRPEQLQRFGSRYLMDVRGVVVDDLEMRVRRFASVERGKGVLELVVTSLAEANVKRTVGRIVGVTSRGHVLSPRP
jgi:hypothetical protein